MHIGRPPPFSLENDPWRTVTRNNSHTSVEFPQRGPKGAGRRYAACTSKAACQMHMPTHIMKAGGNYWPKCLSNTQQAHRARTRH